jgi:kynurenine 3-monooxygenase
MSKKVTVVGAGLTGPLLSIFLSKRGYNVDLYEARPDSRKTNQYAGRSINLALSERGVSALKRLDLFSKIEPFLIPMKGRMIHKMDGTQQLQPYSIHPHEFLYSVSRGLLNQKLLDEADQFKNIHTTFNHRCTGYDAKTKQLHFHNADTQKDITVDTNSVIASDGAFSAVRRSMQMMERFNYAQEFISYGYKELSIPAGEDGKHQIETNALHIWPRKNFMLIALPNLDGSFTCTLFLSWDGEESLNSLKDPPSARAFFQKYFPDALALIKNFDEDFFKNPTGSLVTVKCSPWNVSGNALLIGDAAHAITPFFGQGMNASFEDCLLLDEFLEKSDGNLTRAFTEFSSSRKKDADAIADMAYENFIEMRDLVSDPQFQLRRAIEGELEKNFPEQYRSRYALVSFSRKPYSEVYKIGLKNNELLAKIMTEIKQPSDITIDKLKKYL